MAWIRKIWDYFFKPMEPLNKRGMGWIKSELGKRKPDWPVY